MTLTSDTWWSLEIIFTWITYHFWSSYSFPGFLKLSSMLTRPQQSTRLKQGQMSQYAKDTSILEKKAAHKTLGKNHSWKTIHYLIFKEPRLLPTGRRERVNVDQSKNWIVKCYWGSEIVLDNCGREVWRNRVATEPWLWSLYCGSDRVVPIFFVIFF